MIFKRNSGSYIWEYYMPCAVTVVSSWITFLMLPSDTNRAAILVTLNLVDVAIYQLILENTPRSGGQTGLSYFAMVSNFYIFAAILENALLLLLQRIISNREKSGKKGKTTQEMELIYFRLDKFFLIMFVLTYSSYVIYTTIHNYSL